MPTLFPSIWMKAPYIETRYPTDLPFEIDELEVRRYLDMAERMFAAIRRELYAGGGPHRIQQ